MNPNEADLISFWRQFFTGAMPPLVKRLRSVGSEAAAVLGRDLGKVAVRYLLAQGGATPDVSLAGGNRIDRRTLWSPPLLALDFRQPLLDWMARAAVGKLSDGAQPQGTLGTGDEIALLMIADELAQRPRADLPLAQVVRRGALAWLVHGGTQAPALPPDESFDDALFFVRGRLARAWLDHDPVFPRLGPPLGLAAMLERAEQRALAWQRLSARIQSHQRYDLLAPVCTCADRLWQRMDVDRMVSRVEEVGRFPGESPRQDAYQRLLQAYAWLADLETWAETSRQTSRYDDGFVPQEVFKAYHSPISPHARTQSRRLLEQLRRTL